MSYLPVPVPVPDGIPFEGFIAQPCLCRDCTRDLSSAWSDLGSGIPHDVRDNIPSFSTHLEPYQGTVAEPWQQGYTAETFSGNPCNQWQVGHDLLQKEEDSSAAPIKEAADWFEEGAKFAARSSRPPVSPLQALIIEGREVGRKTKRPQQVECEDEYFPPQKRRRLGQPRSPSLLVAPGEATTVSTGESGGESKEGLASFGHVAAADQERVATPTPHINGALVDAPEVGPSASQVPSTSARARGRNRPRQLSARKGYSLEELGLPPLNPVEEVGTKMMMKEKLEYMLSRLGRPALNQEITSALDAGWPREKINNTSSKTLSHCLSHKPEFVGYTSPYLKGTFWNLAALAPPTGLYPQLEFKVAPKGRRGQRKQT